MHPPRFSDNIPAQMSVRPCASPSRPRLRGGLFAGRLLRGVLLSLLLTSAAVLAKPKVHTVYEGQRLGSIAKRYNVTVEALCAANHIDRKSPIKPGQKLIVPDPDWKPGDDLPELDAPPEKKKDAKAKSSPTSDRDPPGKPRLHVVQKGHTLSAISGRYGITVSAICTANDLSQRASLDVGQTLVIPDKTDKDGRYARKLRLEGRLDEGGSGSSTSSWKQYEKPAWRRGYIKMRRYGRAWQGYVIGPKGEVLGQASSKINFVLGAHDGGPDIDPRLVRLIAQISDKFGGRELRIVSGYRTQSFVAASKHKEGRALDFSIPGVPNEALRDYLRTLDNVGVGYYPNSSFVHLDVRGYNAYWVDYAGPGEAPKKSPHAKSRKGQPIESDEPPDGSAPEHDHSHDGAPDDAAPEESAPDGGAEAPSGSDGADADRAGASGAPSGSPEAGSDPSSGADADAAGAED